jgi:hypothetical protein
MFFAPLFSPGDLMWPWQLYMEWFFSLSRENDAWSRQLQHNSLLLKDAAGKHLVVS